MYDYEPEICTVDGRPILVTIFRGSGVCCEGCRKKRDGDAHFNPDMN